MRFSTWSYLLVGAVKWWGMGNCHGVAGHDGRKGGEGEVVVESLEELERKWGFDVSYSFSFKRFLSFCSFFSMYIPSIFLIFLLYFFSFEERDYGIGGIIILDMITQIPCYRVYMYTSYAELVCLLLPLIRAVQTGVVEEIEILIY